MNNTTNLTIEDYAKLDPHIVITVDGHEIAFSTPNKSTVWRAETIMEKEPITIKWIGSFNKNDTLVDVGANVGMYTLIAAVTRRVQVFAFEPEAQNYSLLIKNIIRNQLSNQVIAWPVALSDEQKFGQIFLSAITAGGSCHAFGEPLDYKLEKKNFPFVQGSVSTTLDDLISDEVVPVPNHIKIDVDGFEHKVIHGCRQTLANETVQSLLIEIAPFIPEHIAMIEELKKFGFTFDAKQVEQSTRKEGQFKGLAEYVFRR